MNEFVFHLERNKNVRVNMSDAVSCHIGRWCVSSKCACSYESTAAITVSKSTFHDRFEVRYVPKIKGSVSGGDASEVSRLCTLRTTQKQFPPCFVDEGKLSDSCFCRLSLPIRTALRTVCFSELKNVLTDLPECQPLLP
jgi:hypothetical protein